MLSAELVEAAFVETAQAQHNGEPFNWDRLARLLNERLADQRETAAGARPALFAGARH